MHCCYKDRSTYSELSSFHLRLIYVPWPYDLHCRFKNQVLQFKIVKIWFYNVHKFLEAFLYEGGGSLFSLAVKLRVIKFLTKLTLI